MSGIVRALVLFGVLALAACATHPGKLAGVARSSDRSEPVVVAEGGAVRGMEAKGVRAFLGVPYAAPPVGPLRWRAPQPVEPWAGERDATRIGSDCVQAIGFDALLGRGGGWARGREDCLYLNVQVPAGTRAGDNLPVMVFAHGGVFTIGSGANYDPSRLAVTQDRVVVTFNYRLGALGWLAHPAFAGEGEGTGGNYGLQDHAAALRWVRRNIAAFGGDPGDVTAFGESAGAWVLCHLMASPEGGELFDRVILQSGSCLDRLSLTSADAAAAAGPAFAAEVGCGEAADVAACLRGLPAGKIARAASTRWGLAGPGSWGPVHGDADVPESPVEAFRSGRFARVPLLAGTNAWEGRLFVARIDGPERYGREMDLLFGDRRAEVEALYPPGPEGLPVVIADAFTDYRFACPTDELRREVAEHAPVWAYEFADPDAPTVLPRFLTRVPLKSTHASELTYVFGTRWALGDPGRFSPDQRALSDRMMRLWAAFGHEGFEAEWARFNDTGAVRVMTPDGDRMDAGFRARRHCDFWDRARPEPVVATVR